MRIALPLREASSFEATPSTQDNTTPTANPLRGDAEEFIPGQPYPPSIGSPKGSFSESPATPPHDARMKARSTSHPAARPQHPTHLFPSEWATISPHQHPFPAIAGPCKYSPPKCSPASRKPSPPHCDVLELDPNTLQPVGYPGHTPLEWREMAQAIHDLNRKLNTDPIPLSSDSSRCAHCGRASHALKDCRHPPLFALDVPQHLTLDRYLRTAHWNVKASLAYIESRALLWTAPCDPAAPLTCLVAPDLHSEAEVARAVDCVVEHLRAERKSLDFDWRGYWMVDFSQCPFMWALRPVDDRGVMYLVFNPTGSVAVRELIVTAEEALKGGDTKPEAEEVSSGSE